MRRLEALTRARPVEGERPACDQWPPTGFGRARQSTPVRTLSVGSRAGAVHKVPVSSPRPIERRIRVSRTPLSCPLRIKGYVTYRAGQLSGLDQMVHPVV